MPPPHAAPLSRTLLGQCKDRWDGQKKGRKCASLCTSLRSHGKSFRGCQLTQQQQLHYEYSLEVFISPNGWGEWVAGRGCRARGCVFPPFKHSLHCLGGVVLSGRDGAGCTNHIPQYHTLTHTVTNAVKVWKCGERSRVHVRSVPAREIGARCHIQTTR